MSGLTFRRAVADGLSQMLESVCGLKLTGTKQVERLFASEIHRRYESVQVREGRKEHATGIDQDYLDKSARRAPSHPIGYSNGFVRRFRATVISSLRKRPEGGSLSHASKLTAYHLNAPRKPQV